MQLNIKNREVVELAEQLARLTGESKTQAVRRALQERYARLKIERNDGGRRSAELLAWLQSEVWPHVPAGELGRTMSREEEEALLGFGESGA